MSRYVLAMRKVRGPTTSVRFPPAKSYTKIAKYIIYCVGQKVIFRAENMAREALDHAVVNVSKVTGIPVMVDNAKEVFLLSTLYSYHKILAPQDVENQSRSTTVIRYSQSQVELPKNAKSYVTILRS